MCCKPLIGICSLENWFRCVQSSNEDRTRLRSHELSRVVAMARLSSVTGPPPDSWRKSSSSSSSTARSATGFLLVFLMRPTSTEMPRCCTALMFFSETNPGAGRHESQLGDHRGGVDPLPTGQGHHEGYHSSRRVRGTM